MSYGLFLALFAGVPVVLLLLLLRGRPGWRAVGAIAALCLAAVVYTAPWDNAIVLNGVWSYGRRQIVGVVLGVVPLEEYLFYGLQVAATVLLYVCLHRRLGR